MIIKNFNSPAEKWLYCQQDRQLPAIILPQPYEAEDCCLFRSLSIRDIEKSPIYRKSL